MKPSLVRHTKISLLIETHQNHPKNVTKTKSNGVKAHYYVVRILAVTVSWALWT